ncbi:hypothetical protein GCK32_021014, partial [Trichostrongylus colubriformis]
ATGYTIVKSGSLTILANFCTEKPRPK